MKKKKYSSPVVRSHNIQAGFPTVLAVGAVSAAVGAASVAVGKMVGDIVSMTTNINFNRQIITGDVYA